MRSRSFLTRHSWRKTAKRMKPLTSHPLSFPNGNSARSVKVSRNTPVNDTLKALDIGVKPQALILIFGGADQFSGPSAGRLAALFSGIARVAADTGALIMDGGTQVGVMELIGQAAADIGRRSLLLGVAPYGRVIESGAAKGGAGRPRLDPNHSHFVLVDCSEWGCETRTLFSLADVIGDRIPVVAILANGGPVSKNEALQTVRRGWPLVIIKGTGGVADKISERTNNDHRVQDHVIAEIAEGSVLSFPPDESPDELRALLGELLECGKNHVYGESCTPILRLAWKRWADYDENARHQQKYFYRIELLILMLGLLATTFALSQTQFGLKNNAYLNGVIVSMPIAISILVAAVNRFKVGNNWVLLRAAAEAVKREIYTYRVNASPYREHLDAKDSREAMLASSLKRIGSRLMGTEVNLAALKPYEGRLDENGKFPEKKWRRQKENALSMLTAQEYLKVRLREQRNWYQDKIKQKGVELRRFQWLIYISGGVGTFLAAIGLQLWIAFTASLAAVFTTYLGYRQTEATLTQYNQAASDLDNIEAWWIALPAADKASVKNVDRLVSFTEKILERELAGWAQHMDDALAKLKTEQEHASAQNK
ncbi:MAG: DUF4231 domain-containing protein [Halobacteriota archaeon]